MTKNLQRCSNCKTEKKENKPCEKCSCQETECLCKYCNYQMTPMDGLYFCQHCAIKGVLNYG